MRTVVFLGPTLQRDAAEALLAAEYRPPAQRGDFYRALRDGVRRIVLIDGEFHGCPSVWPREIVDAIAEGVEVHGASSMGALRAAELYPYGMVGHGEIFDWYRSGVIEADDEVALIYGPRELGYPSLSEPLVNVRATLAEAVSAGVLTENESAELIEQERRRVFTERSFAAMLDGPVTRGWPDVRRAALADHVERRRVDLKRWDAVKTLRTIAAGTAPAGCTDLARPIAHNPIWARGRLVAEGFAETARSLSAETIAARAGLDAAQVATLRRQLSIRFFIGEWVRETGESPDGADPIAILSDWARRHGVEPDPDIPNSDAALAEWLVARGPNELGYSWWHFEVELARELGLSKAQVRIPETSTAVSAPAVVRRLEMAALPADYRTGTYRLVAPEATLARIAPHLSAMGITRAADITGLDRLGIPTWCAVRPGALQTQISNGKGLTHAAAKASALMEAIEHFHAETIAVETVRASLDEMRRRGTTCIPVHELPNHDAGIHLGDARRIDWIRAEALPQGEPVWLPACGVYTVQPMLLPNATNGLASGNHLVEATLHALYEIIERDAVTRLSRGGLKKAFEGRARVVDRASVVGAGAVGALHDQLTAAGVKPVLIQVACPEPVYTFWAVLLDPGAVNACSYVNIGHGSHLDPAVAACRAITEAAQSRLTFIHGAREDLSPASYRFDPAHRRVFAFFDGLRGDLPWPSLASAATGDLGDDLRLVLDGLRTAGFDHVYRADLTRPPFDIPVVKAFVPGMAFLGGFLANHHDQ